MVPALTGPVLMAAGLLAAAAPAKLRRPDDTARVMREMGLPSGAGFVRVLAISELLLGAAVVVRPVPPVLLSLGVVYLSFAAFVAAALRRGVPVSSCGCFGRPDTPPTGSHLAIVVAAAVVSLVAVLTGSASVGEVVVSSTWWGVPLLAATAAGTWLAWAVLAVLPAVKSAAVVPEPSTATFRAVGA